MTKTRLDFEMSSDARFILQTLAESSIDQVHSYVALAAVISRPIDSHFKSALATARRRAESDYGFVFGILERGVSIKRLSDDEIVEMNPSYFDRTRRAAKRHIKTLAVVQFDKLSREKQMSHSQGMAIASATCQMVKSSGQKKVLDAVTTLNGKEPPIAATMALFAK